MIVNIYNQHQITATFIINISINIIIVSLKPLLTFDCYPLPLVKCAKPSYKLNFIITIYVRYVP